MQREPFQEEDLGFTINLVRSTIQKYFIVNDVRYDREAFAFFIQLDPRNVEERFDDLRREMLDLGFVPMLLKERPGYIIYVTRKPERQFRSIYVNVAFLVATIITTIIAGMSFVSSYEDIPFISAEAVAKGALFFAAPLMAILGVHEMGHYFMARKHRVAASLPFFIPAPPILGTFGAFISLREPIHSKRSLMDIGFGGPIAGFVMALCLTVLGLKLSAWDPHPVGDDASAYWILGTPLIYDFLTWIVPTPSDVLIHPTAFAGWVGFLVTFLNLLPAGQLDGGHITRALFGDKARLVGWATVGAMLIIVIVTQYIGWLVFILFIILFMNHPPPLNDISPLPTSRVLLGISAFAMLMVCFVPVPLMPSDLEPSIEVEFVDTDLNIDLEGSVNATLVVVNTGNTAINARFKLQDDHGWNVTIDEKVEYKEAKSTWGSVAISKDRSTNYTTLINITVTPPEGADLGLRETFTVEVTYTSEDGDPLWLTPHFMVTVGWIIPRDVPVAAYVAVDSVNSFELGFKNRVFEGNGTQTVFDLDLVIDGYLEYTLTEASVDNLTAQDIKDTPPLPTVVLGNNDSAELRVWVLAPVGTVVVTDLHARLLVSPRDGSSVSIPFDFFIDVVNPIYDVSIVPLFNTVEFHVDEEKSVPFQLVSRSTVDVNVRFSHSYDGTNWAMTQYDEELTLSVDYNQVHSVRMFANGDVGSQTSLEIEIVYGPNWNQRASATIELLITDSG